MRNRHEAWRYLTALGVAYLLVCQLLLIGVSTGLRFSVAAASHDISLCLGTQSGHEGTTDDAGRGFPPCCSISCPMAGGAGLPPPAFAGSSPVRFASAIVSFHAPETRGRLRHETADFHARGPPVAA